MQPLTHHEILGWMEPFTRRGRHLDLAASDRAERRVAFRPIEHAADRLATPALRETLQLESRPGGDFTLTRAVTLAGGLTANLEVEGSDPGSLLAAIESIPVQRQIRCEAGFSIVQSHRIEPAEGTLPMRMILTNATARLGDLTVTLSVPKIRGTTAGLELLSTTAESLELPNDVLAVLGWPWSRLSRIANGWRAELRLRGSKEKRSRDAESKLEQTVQHLQQTLAGTPGEFHDRHVAARWRVTFRRAFPLLATLVLLGAGAMLPKLSFAQQPGFRAILFNAPTLLFVLVFCLPEVPKIEIPPLPRRPQATSWRARPA
jgi:hypothetical protein